MEVSTLEDVTQLLREEFSGTRVDVDQVRKILSNYKSNPRDWTKYAKFDKYRYTRNLVDQGNGKYNLMLLCWGEGHGSSIHDHADAHCFMKILQGRLQEVRFDWPNGPDSDDPMREIERNTLNTNSVCYINDTMGLHRVENPSYSDTAVSLHLYCPPFESCSIFNQQTGHRSKVQMTFWSKFGNRPDRTKDNRPPEDN